jgi:hypothetical protein
MDNMRILILTAFIATVGACRTPVGRDQRVQLQLATFYKTTIVNSHRLTSRLNGERSGSEAYFETLAQLNAVSDGVISFVDQNKVSLSKLQPDVREKFARELKRKFGYSAALEPLITLLEH